MSSISNNIMVNVCFFPVIYDDKCHHGSFMNGFSRCAIMVPFWMASRNVDILMRLHIFSSMFPIFVCIFTMLTISYLFVSQYSQSTINIFGSSCGLAADWELHLGLVFVAYLIFFPLSYFYAHLHYANDFIFICASQCSQSTINIFGSSCRLAANWEVHLNQQWKDRGPGHVQIELFIIVEIKDSIVHFSFLNKGEVSFSSRAYYSVQYKTLEIWILKS
jgi:hypothetical protein